MVMIVRSFFVIMITMMIMLFGMTKTLFAVENKEVHPEGIEGSDKNTGHHSEVGKAGTRYMRQRNGFNN